jgi:plasmid replication initiation protein
MFDFKREYTTYELWNVLQLKSVNQFRMYEILKQYENLGERTIKLEELKSLLGIEKNEYPLWQTFKIDVLNVCQQALKEYTDIKFEWEVSKRGQRGKITELRFFISKNENYKDVLNLDLFLKNYAYQENPKLTYKECDSETDFNPSTNSFKVNGTNVNTQKKKITTEEMEFAQNHNLWQYALEIAQNSKDVRMPIAYATKILFTWLGKGYQDHNDLIKAGVIQGQVTNYDLRELIEMFE